MRFLAILTLLFASVCCEAQTALDFEGSFEELFVQANREDKRILIDFYAEWCAPCKKMDAEVFSDPEVAAYLKRYYYGYKLDTGVEENGEAIAASYGVEAYPVILFLDQKGNELGRVKGFLNKEDFIAAMKKYGPQIPNNQYTEFR